MVSSKRRGVAQHCVTSQCQHFNDFHNRGETLYGSEYCTLMQSSLFPIIFRDCHTEVARTRHESKVYWFLFFKLVLILLI